MSSRGLMAVHHIATRTADLVATPKIAAAPSPLWASRLLRSSPLMSLSILIPDAPRPKEATVGRAPRTAATTDLVENSIVAYR